MLYVSSLSPSTSCINIEPCNGGPFTVRDDVLLALCQDTSVYTNSLNPNGVLTDIIVAKANKSIPPRIVVCAGSVEDINIREPLCIRGADSSVWADTRRPGAKCKIQQVSPLREDSLDTLTVVGFPCGVLFLCMNVLCR